jgi:hypothetical protein
MKKLSLFFSLALIATGIFIAQARGFTQQGKPTDRDSSPRAVVRFESRFFAGDFLPNQGAAAGTAIAAFSNRHFQALLDFVRGPITPASDGFGILPQTDSQAPATTPTPTTATWVGGNGDWSAASNWSPAVVPNNGGPFPGTTYAVIINNGSQVSVTINPTIDSLTIGAADRLVINQSLTVVNTGVSTGTISNAGTISLNSQSLGGPTTDLKISGGDVTLTGGGIIVMSNAARILGTGTETLINQNNTIQGAGQIGANLMRLNNQGTISARDLGSLTINPAGNSSSVTAGTVNSGALQALPNGILLLSDGRFDNSGGMIHANGSTVQVVNSVISGGTVDVLENANDFQHDQRGHAEQWRHQHSGRASHT